MVMRRKWKRIRRVLVYWNSSYGSEKTQLIQLAYSLRRRRLLMKKLRVMVVLVTAVRVVLVSLKGVEKIAAVLVMVGGERLIRSPWIRQGEVERGTTVRFRRH